LSVRLTLFAVLALLSYFLVGVAGSVLGLLAIGAAVVELFFPPVVVSGGSISVVNSARGIGYDVYPLADVANAKIWPKYAALDLGGGRTVSIRLGQFTRSSRAAFVRDLELFLETRAWPSTSHAA
jgi:hypothetical protein